jgi:tetratricopeptide (TPR) repeat protein
MRMAETPMEGFRRNWPFYGCAAAASAILVFLLWRARSRHGDFFAGNNFALCAIAFTALLWVVMYWHNLPSLTPKDGFDAEEHMKYIQRVASKPGLPLASDGWQMYQPPLYYMISAVAVEIFNPETVAGYATVVRILGLGIGIIHLALIFLSLRLVFPARPGTQFFGLLLAALLPAHLYVAQYVTNESLAAMLVTASIFLCLKIVLEKRDSWKIFAALGLTFGAALLAKVTAVLAAPFIALALVDVSIWREPARLKLWLSNVGIAAALCFAVCGWHYCRVWSHFGTPLAGNWTPSVWPAWWMEPGFRTCTYFFRFGACLVHPWFSGFDGFADGLYSTLWGDGLLGGAVAAEHRPCWNYELMAAGFILGLIPSCFILAGALRAFKTLLQAPSRVWLMLVGLPFGVVAALVYMNLEVPTYGEAKAFYGLIALFPLCAWGALGFDSAKRLARPVLTIGLILFGIWAINSYATFWTQTDSADAQIRLGLGSAREGTNAVALQLYSAVVRAEPHNMKARAFQAIEYGFHGRTNEIPKLAADALGEPLTDGPSHFYLAEILGLDRQFDAAAAEARKAIAREPDNALYYDALCSWLCRPGHYAEAISVGREGERVSPYVSGLHYNFGRAFAGIGDQTNAILHLRLANLLTTDWPDACDRLGMSLLALGQYSEATNLISRALRASPHHPVFQYHLALALAAMGDSSGEVEQYRECLRSDPKYRPALESLAWRLATSPDPRLRSATEAVQLASTALRQSGTNDAQCLLTLSAAYASAGQFEDAIQTAKHSADIAERAHQADVAARGQKLLKFFQSGQPYVDENPKQPVIPPDSEEN